MRLLGTETDIHHLVVVVVRILPDNHHLHILPLAVCERVEHVLSGRKDLLSALLFRLQEFLRLTLPPRTYQQFLKVRLCRLLVDERSPVSRHAGVELANPGRSTPYSSIQAQLWLYLCRFGCRLFERWIALHWKPLFLRPTTMCFSKSCWNTAKHQFHTQNAPSLRFAILGEDPAALKKESIVFCAARFIVLS